MWFYVLFKIYMFKRYSVKNIWFIYKANYSREKHYLYITKTFNFQDNTLLISSNVTTHPP